jgi:hypothetical protein
VVVAAAGNITLTGTGPVHPASCAGVLAVGAVQRDGSLWPGSTRQPYVAVAAPGAGLVTSGRDGRLVGVNGTRSASALVAGAAALIRSRYRAMPWYEVVHRRTGTALPEGGTVPNDSFGYGIVRLDRAVNTTAFPLPASAPNPVYAKYLAWLATPAGRSVSRQLGGSTSPPTRASRPAAAASPARNGSSSTRRVMIFLALLVGVSVGAVLTAARKRIRRNRRNAPFGPTGSAFPDPAGAPGEWPPYGDASYWKLAYERLLSGDQLYGDPLAESPPLKTPPYGKPQYRNPPYTAPQYRNPPDSGRYPAPRYRPPHPGRYHQP